MSDYLAIDALSSGVCHTLLTESPLHAKWRKEHPTDATDKMDIGTIAHQILLEGTEDGIVVVDAADWRTKVAQSARDAARAEGKAAILAVRLPQVREMVAAARRFLEHSPLAGALEHGQAEGSMEWIEHGVACKVRPDFMPDDHPYILHVKTTDGTAAPNAWIRNHLFGSGYDVTAAFYEHGLPDRESIFLVIEQNAPYGCSLIGLDPMSRDNAERKVTRAMAIWADCMRTGKWPCYPTDICYAETPAWELAETERMEIDPVQQREGLQP
jgi:hypothetical protein